MSLKIKNIPTTLNYILGIIEDDLILNLDAGDDLSYPGGATLFDLSDNNNNGTIIGSPAYVLPPGYFDIVSDSTFITTNSYSHRTNDFTYSFWIQFDALGGNQVFFENGLYTDGMMFRLSGGTSIQVYIEGAVVGTFSWSPSTGTWYNVVYRRSDSENALYINGVLTGPTFTDLTDVNIGSYPLMYLMRAQYASNQFINGKIGQFSVYSAALEDGDIEGNFEALRERFGV